VEPELQVMIKEQQDKLRKEYELKLAGLVRLGLMNPNNSYLTLKLILLIYFVLIA